MQFDPITLPSPSGVAPLVPGVGLRNSIVGAVVKGQRFAENPFFVLGLPTSASLADVERTSQKLVAQLTIGAESAKTYASPFGLQQRDESKVRAAAAALRSPQQRLLCELWAEDAALKRTEPQREPLPVALDAIRWRLGGQRG